MKNTRKKVNNGFTLIELLTVFSIIGVLTALGVQSFTSFNNTQTVTIATSGLVTTLQRAKSSAISQVIPASCATKSLTGYEVDISMSARTYTLFALCGGKKQIEKDTLPPNITFVSGSTTTVIFALGTGTINIPASISLKGYGKTVKITVSKTGNTTIQ